MADPSHERCIGLILKSGSLDERIKRYLSRTFNGGFKRFPTILDLVNAWMMKWFCSHSHLCLYTKEILIPNWLVH